MLAKSQVRQYRLEIAAKVYLTSLALNHKGIAYLSAFATEIPFFVHSQAIFGSVKKTKNCKKTHRETVKSSVVEDNHVSRPNARCSELRPVLTVRKR